MKGCYAKHPTALGVACELIDGHGGIHFAQTPNGGYAWGWAQ